MYTSRLVSATVLLWSAFSAAQTAVPSPLVVAPPAPAGQPAPIPAARWTPAQLRQAFDEADTDSDGRLSRSEAQRLAILPRSFEDLDRNKDGVLERAEYEGSIAK